MFAMFNQFFRMFTLLFTAGESGAQALASVAKVAEEKARGFQEEQAFDLEEAAMKRAKRRAELKVELAVPAITN